MSSGGVSCATLLASAPMSSPSRSIDGARANPSAPLGYPLGHHRAAAHHGVSMNRLILLTVSSALAIGAACGGPTPPEDAGPRADSGAPDASLQLDAGPPACGTTSGGVPDGLTTLASHDGAGVASLASQTWAITVNAHTYTIAEERAYEQARFEIERPARIHGFRVKWADLGDAAPTKELEAGLYPDFGHNGFDMWSQDPYWTGTRCAGDVDAEGWITYALDEPVEIAQPGLVYVGHLREGAGEPAWLFDGSTDDPMGSCDLFDSCRASINMPDAESATFYNGVSVAIPYDFMVELLVEYTAPELEPSERVFTAVDGITLSNRVAFGDFDDDGWDDFVTTGPRLYHNEGDGTFTDVTDVSGLAGIAAGGSGVFGDYDNDGCLDLFVFAESMTVADALLRNQCDGTFADVTSSAGIVDMQSYETCGDPANVRAPTPAAAWADLDADGYLDLYLANFICWSSGATYRDTVFHNRGDGTFEEWTGTRGFSSERTAARGAAPIDYDRDGDIDVLVNRYRLERNFFFENLGDGTFQESALDHGLAGNPTAAGGTYYGHTIGVAWGDLDNDGDFDVVQANLAHPRFFNFSDKTQVLLDDGTGHYEDFAGEWLFPAGDNGLIYRETHSVPALADFDGDGALDLVITCVYDGRPTDFYWGNGDGSFRLDVFHAGITTENGWGLATSDWDHDGDPDLAAGSLFTNGTSSGHFLSVRVIGNVAANRAAIGAVVSVTTGGVTQLRQVQGGTGQGCQDSMYLHFGLGDATQVDSIEVEFPGGASASFTGPFDADQRLWLYEDGTMAEGWSPPAR